MESKNDNNIKILIPYKFDDKKSSIVVIAVRPETNKIDYESVIISGCKDLASPVYMANLPGNFIRSNQIVSSHYRSQVIFARYPKENISKYPEMISLFEDKFQTSFATANIVGSFKAVNELRDETGLDEQELFHKLVPRKDFLEFYGHTIKKIGNFFIVNYDLPAVIHNYSSESNILVMALKIKNNTPFHIVNKSIFDNFMKETSTDILDYEDRHKMEWFNQVRRTYHISSSHIESMFDLKDYVFKDSTHSVSFEETPLGHEISKNTFFDDFENTMAYLKNNPLQYIINDNNDKELVNLNKTAVKFLNSEIIEDSLKDCAEIFKRIITPFI